MTEWPDDWFRESPSAKPGGAPLGTPGGAGGRQPGRALTPVEARQAGLAPSRPRNFPTDPAVANAGGPGGPGGPGGGWPAQPSARTAARRACRHEPAALAEERAIRAATASPAGGAG